MRKAELSCYGSSDVIIVPDALKLRLDFMQNAIHYTCRIRDLVLTNNLAPPASFALARYTAGLLFQSLLFIASHRQTSVDLNMPKICGFPGPIILQHAYGWLKLSPPITQSDIRLPNEEFEFRVINLMLILDSTGEIAAAAAENDYISRSATLFRDLKRNLAKDPTCAEALYNVSVGWGCLARSASSAQNSKVVEDIIENGVLYSLEWCGATCTGAVEDESDFKRNLLLSLAPSYSSNLANLTPIDIIGAIFHVSRLREQLESSRHDKLRLQFDLQLKKILYRMSRPHIPIGLTTVWVGSSHFNFDTAHFGVGGMDKYCSLVGCDSDTPASLVCAKCQTSRYCSRSCQKR